MENRRKIALITGLSLIILLISCTDGGFVADMAKIIWLVFMAIVSSADFGAAFGMLLLSLSIYNPKHVWAPESIFDRVDTCALIIIVVVFVVKKLRLPLNLSRSLMVSMSVFLVYILVLSQLHGLLNWYNFAQFTRMFGLPFFLFLMLQKCSLSNNEILSFCRVVIIMGAYMAFTSVMEKLQLHSLLIPYWVGDPAINGTIGSGRSGGLLMQPEFNGFALSLIYCVILASIYLNRSYAPVVKYSLCALCLIGLYFSYTRGAWLAALLATILFMFKYGLSSTNARYKSVLAIIALTLLIVAGSFINDRSAHDRTADSGTIYYRLNLWHPALKMIIKKPLFGHGIGQFEKTVYEYHEPLNIGPKMIMPFEEGTGTHNVFLNLLTEHGVVGLLLYGYIFISIVAMARASSIRLWGKAGSLWVLAYTLVYLVNTQFLNAHESVTNLLYFGTMGIITGSEST